MKPEQFDSFSLLISNKEFEEARKLADSVLESDPKNADAIGLRAVARFYLKDLSCIEDVNLAVELEPKNAYRYSSRAYIMDALGNSEAAVQDYLKAVELDPDDEVAFNNLGMLEEKLGRKQSAKKYFERSDKLVGAEEKKEAFKKPSLQDQINIEKTQTKWEVLRGTLKNRSGWEEFLSFVSLKLKKKVD